MKYKVSLIYIFNLYSYHNRNLYLLVPTCLYICYVDTLYSLLLPYNCWLTSMYNGCALLFVLRGFISEHNKFSSLSVYLFLFVFLPSSLSLSLSPLSRRGAVHKHSNATRYRMRILYYNHRQAITSGFLRNVHGNIMGA